MFLEISFWPWPKVNFRLHEHKSCNCSTVLSFSITAYNHMNESFEQSEKKDIKSFIRCFFVQRKSYIVLENAFYIRNSEKLVRKNKFSHDFCHDLLSALNEKKAKSLTCFGSQENDGTKKWQHRLARVEKQRDVSELSPLGLFFCFSLQGFMKQKRIFWLKGNFEKIFQIIQDSNQKLFFLEILKDNSFSIIFTFGFSEQISFN